MKALANEIAKNLMLAGIGSLTIIDDQIVVDEDLGSQFFITEHHVGLNVRCFSTWGYTPPDIFISEQRQRHHRFESLTQEFRFMLRQ